MPELPEVNTVMKGFRENVLGHMITGVEIHDDKIIRNVSREEFSNALKRRKFVDTYRQGKYFFGVLENDLVVLFHLGMTGDLVYYFDGNDKPKYERFSLKFDSGLVLGYDDLRKFSNILLLDDLHKYLGEIGLGPDALTINYRDFSRVFEGRSTTLKSVLMDQQSMAGIGNLYADEICYQARLHPASVAGALSPAHLKKLHHLTHQILQEACDRDAYYKIYPDNWFWKWRNDSIGQIQGKGEVKKMKIGGRTTYFVEGYQVWVH